jgi:hypothetical protein
MFDKANRLCMMVNAINKYSMIKTPEQEQARYDFYQTYTAWSHSVQLQPNHKPLHITLVAMDTAIKHYKEAYGLNERTQFEDVIKHYMNNGDPSL